jgi:hypothetical protein
MSKSKILPVHCDDIDMPPSTKSLATSCLFLLQILCHVSIGWETNKNTTEDYAAKWQTKPQNGNQDGLQYLEKSPW